MLSATTSLSRYQRGAIAVALGLLLAASGPPASGQEKKPRANRAAAQGDAAPVQGEGGAPAQISIDWDGGKLVGIPQIVKRLYRLRKSGQWSADRLPKLCRLCLDSGNPKLKLYATWYTALVAGHEGKTDEAAKKLKEAIELGYLNVIQMEESPELAQAREKPEVKALIESVKTRLEKRMVDNFKAGVDTSLQASKALPGDAVGPALQTADGKPLLPEGKPAVLVLARTNHEPLEQFIPLLKKLEEKAPLALALWQLDPADPSRRKEVPAYLQRLKERFGFTPPTAVIGRAKYVALRDVARTHFQQAEFVRERSVEEEPEVFMERLPILFLLNARGVPVHSTLGVLADWQVDYLAAKLAELPATASTPAPEESAKAKEPEPAAETPEKSAPEKPAENAPPTPQNAEKPGETPESKASEKAPEKSEAKSADSSEPKPPVEEKAPDSPEKPDEKPAK